MPAAKGKPSAETLAALADLAALYPNEPEHLRRYADALLAAGETMQALDTYRRLYRLLRAHGKLSEAQQLIERFPEIGIAPEAPPEEPLGERWPQTGMARLWRLLRARTLAAGDVLGWEEASAQGPWIVLTGRLAAVAPATGTIAFEAPRNELIALGPALGLEEPALSYRAVMPSKIAPLPRARLAEAFAAAPAFAGAVRQALQRRALLAQLAAAAGFRAASLGSRRYLALKARVESLRPQTRIWREGALARELILVLAGKLALSVQVRGAMYALGTLGPGRWIAGLPLLADAAKAPAEVCAQTPVQIARFGLHELRAAALAQPTLLEGLADAAEQLQQTIARRVLALGQSAH